MVSPDIAPPAWHDSRFMKACRREPVDATPIWLMRQAGRYMKEYRELRARVPFLELCKSPDLVAEVTVSAAEKLGVDAAILFADLLLIAEPLGFELTYGKGEGPQITPAIEEPGDVERLRDVEPEGALGYVLEGVRRSRAALNSRLPLIGFAGAPFTLASYLIEGGASRHFARTKRFMYRHPEAWHALMDHLARALARYAAAQLAAGAQALQIFDSWVGTLAPDDYLRYVQPHSRTLFQALPTDAPVIHFGTGTAMLLEAMRAAGGTVIGLDWHVELDEAWKRVGYETPVQGNLDPAVLLADVATVRARALRILEQAGGRAGHIFNLGHGVLPETPYENVLALVETVHGRSAQRAPAG
jgi:uroporphyrinogen decarboxylase